MKEIDATLTAMTTEEQDLLAERQAQAVSRSDWVQRLILAATAVTILALLWAARLLNQAYARSYRAETEQRTLAARLRASLDSLSQGVGVFGPAHKLRHWNECFQVLLESAAGDGARRDALCRLRWTICPPMASLCWKARSRSSTASKPAASRSSMSGPTRTARSSKSGARPCPMAGLC